jgi:protein SCO1/2
MDFRKKINVIFFSSVIIIPVTVFGLMRWVNNNFTRLPYYGSVTAPVVSNDTRTDVHFTVPAFSFTNQTNQTITNDFVTGKIWVADYFFTTCKSICPKLTSHLKAVQAAYAGDGEVKIISFTVDPERDSPSVLYQYASGYDAQTDQWQFVTGSKKELYAFARKGLFIVATDGDGSGADFIHSEKLVLIDKYGHIRGYYDGTSDTEVNQLIKDIQRLKNEK